MPSWREGDVGFHPWDRALGLDGKSVMSGAESLCADAVSSDSYEAASRKLRNLAGVDISKTTLQRRGVRVGRKSRRT